ncbi:MAG: TPR end-of-group domain-containing protein, partial [Ginsengibacter sp.]
FAVPDKKKIEGKLKEKKNSRKRNLIAAVSIILLIIASFFLHKSFTGRVIGEKIKSIAVLPFVNGSSDNENDYLSDGIAQEIISRISKIGSIEVKGWLSSVSLKNSNKSLKEKGEALGADGIVSGDFQKEGNKVLIRVEFDEVSTGKRLWGDEYKMQWDDVLNIQTEVAEKIASALNAKLTPQEKMDLSKHYTENIEAYKLYRLGEYFLNLNAGNGGMADSAKLYFNKALSLDPDYAIAYSGLAECYFFKDAGLKQLDWLPISKTYALKALSLDSTLSEALTTIGWIQSSFEYDWAGSKITLEKAIASDPNNAQAHLFYGNHLQYTRENAEKGISEVKKAIQLDPLNGRFNWVLGRNYYFARKYDSAYIQLKKEIDLHPNDAAAIAYMVLDLVAKKQFAQAFELINRMGHGTSKYFFYKEQFTSYVYAASGDTTRARSELNKVLKEDPGMSPYILAGTYIQLKDYNKALTSLERAYDIRDIGMYYFLVDPGLDPIRNEPRFKEILKKMRLK